MNYFLLIIFYLFVIFYLDINYHVSFYLNINFNFKLHHSASEPDHLERTKMKASRDLLMS